MNNVKSLYLVVALIVIAATLRIYKLDFKELHVDEKASIACSVGVPYGGITQVGCSTWEDLHVDSASFTSADFWRLNTMQDVYKSTLQDNGSIFYFTTLHYWAKLCGFSPFTYRLFSTIFSILTVVAVYFIVLSLFKSKAVAFASALLLAFHPLHIVSAQFVRSHTFTCFFTVLSSFFLIRLSEERSTRYIILYGLSCALAMLSHYFASYVIVGHVLYMALFERKKDTWKVFVIAGAVAVVLFSCWMLLGGLDGMETLKVVNVRFRQFSDNWKPGDNPYFMPARIDTLAGGIIQMLLAVSGNLMQYLGFHLKQIGILAIALWGALLFSMYVLRAFDNKVVRLLLCVMAAYFVWAVFISLRSNLIIFFVPQYGIYLVPCVCILLGYVLVLLFEQSRKKTFYGIVAFQACLMLISLAVCYKATPLSGNYFPGEAEKVKEQQIMDPGKTYAHRTWEEAFFINLYLKDRPDIRQKVLINNSSRN